MAMAKASVKKAGVGSSHKTGGAGGGEFNAISLSKAHSSGKSVPTFNAARIDKLERSKTKGSGGVRK